MHPRSPYRNPPDFLALAAAYPPLKPHVLQTPNGPATIDFKDEASQRRLTEAILQRDFGLKMELPPGRLCPPVWMTLNYILWLEDVIQAVLLADPEQDSERIVRGLDIGTGASAIYPLLGCSTHSNWVFTATEVDDMSLQSAARNIDANRLQDRIALVRAVPDDPILLPLFQRASDTQYDFTMCNPPFYSSREDVIQSAEAKEFEPNAVCTGADTEMITPGGEAAFVGRMLMESLGLRNKCRWFTSMLGKMSTLTHIVQLLRENKVDKYAITELVQGQTRRWVIAWSFGSTRLPDGIGRLSHHGLQSIMPPRNTLHQPLPRETNVAEIAPRLSSVLASIPGVSVTARLAAGVDVVVSSTGNTWSRAARRKKQEAMQVEDGAPVDIQLVCRIRCEREAARGESGTVVVIDWVKGTDRALFESFASHVQRKMLST
ncbi:S-adenosyl-L-methionine dependent methyltransferase [Earliella scabrosa]|nr:S-adenosyl-L-methionine dependent methyltransferase [Earliella scabrosa]